METAILGLVIAIQIGVIIWLGKQLMNTERERQTDREALISKHIRDREELADKFENDRKLLTDKLLKRNGMTPVYQEKKETEKNGDNKQPLSRR